jgi:hypothetical protein
MTIEFLHPTREIKRTSPRPWLRVAIEYASPRAGGTAVDNGWSRCSRGPTRYLLPAEPTFVRRIDGAA